MHTAPEEPVAGLAASDELFRIAFDHAPTGMAIISLVPGEIGRFVRVNSTFCAMLGRDAAELVQRTFLDVTHPDDRERDWGNFQQLVREEIDLQTVDKRYVHKDGHSVHADIASRVAPGPAGGPLCVLMHAVDVTQRRQEQAELQRLALTDPLTGLANRTLLNDRLDQALARLNRDESYAALLLLDVDRFKFVNETGGHNVGDELLVAIAGRIEAVSRADATVARVGGDEFVVLVEGLSSPAEVHRIAVRLLETLRQPYKLAAVPDPVVTTVSIGVSIARQPDRPPSDVHREADLALYRAKDAGRDQYALFDDELRARVVARMESENLLRRAISEDRLVAHYQPVVDLATGAVIGVEALVRVTDALRGLVYPHEFIDVAEETGLIRDVDLRMFELAVGQVAAWTAAGLGMYRLAVNVSARSMDDPDFVDRIRSVLTWFDVPGELVRIELTERSLLGTSPTVHSSLMRLNQLGLHVGLDDFGTGYSAMAYLQRFDLRFMKIDRSFVSRLGQSARDNAVVAAVIALAHAHELVVVAEGIETQEQLDLLRAMGCDAAQGFLIAEPLAAKELEALLREGGHW